LLTGNNTAAADIFLNEEGGGKMKAIIIGGDAAGMSAASKLKRVQPDSEIVVYEKSRYISYAACGLPYLVTRPEIEAGQLLGKTAEEFTELGIKTLLLHEVTKVMPDTKKVIIKNLATGAEFEDSYDRLMIACGARPVVPPFPGIDLPGVVTLKTIDDGILLKSKFSQADSKNIIIIGGGAIGIEVAESLAASGKKIRIIEMGERILMPFDPEIADIAHQELVQLGIELNLSEKLEAIQGNGKVEKVTTDKGTYPADLVLMAIGVRPATEFLKDTGIRLAKNGAVIIDREMRSSLPDIYAAGDCAEVYNLLREENSYIALGTNANKCGRIAGENLAGKHKKFAGTLGSAAMKVGTLELARTGLSEKEAQDLQLDYQTVMVKTFSHPLYISTSAPIWFKVISEKGTQRILGAQGAGRQGVVLRMDVFACAIANEMSAEDLGMLDLCYSPPFANVWDAIHVAANAVK
jgi:NADPH-dependent 2,4-dienoyl-CoA reductase/sulfur reductase-like enzyme